MCPRLPRKSAWSTLAVFATLLLVLQNFVGLPIASAPEVGDGVFAKFRVERLKRLKPASAAKSDPEVPSIRLFPALPRAMQTPCPSREGRCRQLGRPFCSQEYNAMVISAGLPYLQLHKFVMTLVIGVALFYETGFLEHKVLDKANAMGYAMFFCLIFIWVSLPKATPELVRLTCLPAGCLFRSGPCGDRHIHVLHVETFRLFVGNGSSHGGDLPLRFPATFIITDEVTNAGCAYKGEGSTV